MPRVAEFQLEDGRIAGFEIPDGMSDAEADQLGRAELARMQEASKPPVSRLIEGASSLGGQAADIVKQFAGGAAKGAGELGDLMVGGLQAISPTALPLQAMGAKPFHPNMGGQINEMLPKAETTAGRFAKSIGEMVPGTLTGTPGLGAGTKAALAIGSGAGAEALDSRHDNPLMRFLGSLVGGLPGVGGAMKASKMKAGNAETLLAGGVAGLTDKDFAQAKAMQAYLTKEGYPHVASQLFGSKSGLPELLNEASGLPEVRAKLTNLLEDLPDAVKIKVTDYLMSNFNSGMASRGDVRTTLQEAANAALEGVKGRARADYQKAMPLPFNYDSKRVEALYNTLVSSADNYLPNSPQAQAIKKFAELLVSGRTDQQGFQWVKDASGRQVLQQTTKSVPEFHTDSEQLNNMYKAISADVAKLPDEFKSLPLKDVRGLWKKATPEFQPARDAYRARMNQEYEPMSKSLTGTVANFGGGVQADKVTATEGMMGRIFPKEAQPKQITQLAADTRGAASAAHPEYQTAFADTVAEHIRNTMSTALDKNISLHGGKQAEAQIPATIAEKLVGSGEGDLSSNVSIALREAAKSQGLNPRDVERGFANMMKAFATYANVKMKPGIAAVEAAHEAEKNVIGRVMRPARAVDDMVRAKEYQKIADILTSPDGLATLAKLRGYSPWSGVTRAMLTDLFNSGTAAEGSDRPKPRSIIAP